jgi:hypothetical protein
MSQPLAIFSRFNISEQTYKHFLEIAKPVVTSTLFKIIKNGYAYSDRVVFHYNKSGGYLSAHFSSTHYLFSEVSRSSLLQSPEYELMQQLYPLMHEGESGYLVATTDALNIEKEWFVTSQKFENQNLSTYSWTDKDLEEIRLFLNKTFFSIDIPLDLALHESKIIDKKIAREVIQRMKNEGLVKEEELKKLQKGDTIYYKSIDAVYNEQMQLIPEADAKTFKLSSISYAEDKNYVFLNSKPIPKSELGDFTVNESGYFAQNLIIKGNKKLALPNRFIDEIDAPSFEWIYADGQELVKDFENPSGVHAGNFAVIGKDKNSFWAIYRNNIFDGNNEPIVEKIENIETFLNWLKTELESLRGIEKLAFVPELDSEKPEESIDIMFEYLNKLKKNGLEYPKYNTAGWEIRQYHIFCRKKYQATQDKRYLEKAIFHVDDYITQFQNGYDSAFVLVEVAKTFMLLGNTNKTIEFLTIVKKNADINLFCNEIDFESILKLIN